jgi:predicted ATPase/DNA-binding SARP family transcriptional activator/Tfp pilus assembly protein PilF
MKAQNNTAGHKQVKETPKGKAPLEITTLGGLSIRCDGQPVKGLHSRKAEALLVYLAATAHPQPREVLAALFWGEFSQQRAMNNLRVVLSNLRKHLGDHLSITRDKAAMNLGVDYDLDVAVLDANLGYAGEFVRKTGTLNRDTVTRIEQAVDLYKGEFLEGFYVENAPEFDAWMVVERERFHHIVLDGLGKLVRWELAQGEYTTGIRHASKWVRLEPLSEAAYRQMMRLLVFSEQRSAALAQFEKCREVLADELGVAPDTKTTALYEQIKEGNLSSDETISQLVPPSDTAKADIRRHNLPIQTTLFIGRETELAEMKHMLTDPSVRLVTALGAGGMGKTRLALEAGVELMDQFPDGVMFVSLSRLRSEELIVPSIIQVLGIEFAREDTEVGDSKQQLKEVLLHHLRRKQLLLILDSFEHLLDGVALVGEILKAAPGVKVLATSRARLNVGGEHRFQVAGMEYPEDVNIAEAQKFSAVRLFMETARRAQANFEPQPDEMKYIINICRLVEGMPLGIRLAAAWVETLPPGEIAAEIAKNLDLLETDLRDVPERHRSIRALFDHSWNLLTEREREVLQGFSVFRGGCTREAAHQITGATLRDLKSLVDKSLLNRALNGRYVIHDLTKEYAAEKLRETITDGADLHNQHSAYYTAAMQALGEELQSASQADAMAKIDEDIGNFRAAWNWASEQRQAALLEQSIEGFRYYYAIRRLRQEAETAFRQAADRFTTATTGDELRVYARLLSMLGYFSENNDQKKELYQQSLKIFNKLDEEGKDIRFEKALVQNFMGHVALPSDFDEAIRLYEQSLELFHDLSNRYWTAEGLLCLGDVYINKGDLDEAQKNLDRSLVIFQELGDPRRIALVLRNFDFIARRQGKFDEAERLARQILAIYKKIGDNTAIADGNEQLGEVLLLLGKYQEAHAYFKEASIAHKELEDFGNFLDDMYGLCWTKIELGWYEQAWDEVQSALDWCREKAGGVADAYITGKALCAQGGASLALGRFSEAERLLQESIAAFQQTYTSSISTIPYSNLGIVSILLGQPDRAREYFRSALKMGVEISSAMAHMYALPGVALLLAKQGDLERAVEIYALAMRHPGVDTSRYLEDVVGRHLNSLTANMPDEIIAAARKRGQERDLEATVRELLDELL